MSEPIIQVENLGKKYIIGHKVGGAIQGSFPTFRDRIAETTGWLKNQAISRLTDKKVASPADEEFWALKDLSFEIKRGERVGIIGRNGAGKSTLLKVLSRITEPTTGRINLNGRVASLLEVGTGFHPELTGRENIYLNGAVLGMSKVEIKRKFDEIVDFAEVENFLDTPVKRYSSGMYVRLAFAVAAHLEPEILIVDEVLAVGDIQFQKKCLGKMENLSESNGRTLLFVSHNMDAIQRLCSRCLMMENGRLVIDNDTSDAIKKYISQNSYQATPNQWIDLTNVSRQGTGEARFVALQYSSLNSDVAYCPYTDGSLEFLLTIESEAETSVNSLAFTIYSQSGIKLVNADIATTGHKIDLKKGKNIIKFAIEKLSLNSGIYVLGLWLDKIGNSSGQNALDYIESAFEFEVFNLESEGFRASAVGFVPCQFTISKIT
jgi:lipopolysaccharide transport system ATP-binding protein